MDNNEGDACLEFIITYFKEEWHFLVSLVRYLPEFNRIFNMNIIDPLSLNINTWN